MTPQPEVFFLLCIASYYIDNVDVIIQDLLMRLVAESSYTYVHKVMIDIPIILLLYWDSYNW